MAVVFYCRLCHEGFRHNGGILPDVCPRCREPVVEWMTYHDLMNPRRPYVLTYNDRLFLKGIKIAPEDDPLSVES